MNSPEFGGSWFTKETREDSFFGQQVLQLNQVWWMSPHAWVEHIPADWSRVTVVIYHAYLRGFNMGGDC